MTLDEKDAVDAILHVRDRAREIKKVTWTDFFQLFIMPQYVTGKNGNRHSLAIHCGPQRRPRNGIGAW